MALSLDKILTISAKEYFEMIDADPKNYYPVGLEDCGPVGEAPLSKRLAAKSPEKTEVIVGYKVTTNCSSSTDNLFYIATGTALIKKKMKVQS